MTLEERVARLETFMGDIDKITSVYANSVQQICDKYLNLLYIEEPDESHPEMLNVTGFLSELTTADNLPHNVCFNVRASHTFAYSTPGVPENSTIKFTRDEDTITLPLKKYDIENPGELIYLEPSDYLSGVMYSIYINSQNIAVISSNDSGAFALQEVQQLATQMESLSDAITALATSFSTSSLTATSATIGTLAVSTALTLTNSFHLPSGTTCSDPSINDASAKVASTYFVNAKCIAKLNAWWNDYIVITNGSPTTALLNKPNGAICFKY